jgi:hypothetical protein
MELPGGAECSVSGVLSNWENKKVSHRVRGGKDPNTEITEKFFGFLCVLREPISGSSV